MRPHRIPCHRRGNHRLFPAPCSSEPASHRIRSIIYYKRPQKMIAVRNPAADADMLFAGVSARPPPARSSVPTAVGTLVTHGKTGVCARISITSDYLTSGVAQNSPYSRTEPSPTGRPCSHSTARTASGSEVSLRSTTSSGCESMNGAGSCVTGVAPSFTCR
jgi:hypothetical protein